MEAGARLHSAPREERTSEQSARGIRAEAAGCCRSFSTPLIYEEHQTLLIRFQIIFPNRPTNPPPPQGKQLYLSRRGWNQSSHTSRYKSPITASEEY